MSTEGPSPPTKRPRTSPSPSTSTSSPRYELLYHKGIPGRGEFIRLLLEASGTPYTDLARDTETGSETVRQICISGLGEEEILDGVKKRGKGNPPVFAPPALRILHVTGSTAGEEGEGEGDEAIVISQTPAILAYLGEATGMDGGGTAETKIWVAALALTALDLTDEVHDSHHPIASAKYYEEQKEEAGRKSRNVREVRIPKFLGHFEKQVEWNREYGDGEGRFLVGAALTYADTTVWQVLDGLMYAFPREMEVRKAEFPRLLGSGGFYDMVKEEEKVGRYLASERRCPYGMGIFRRYPELDRPE